MEADRIEVLLSEIRDSLAILAEAALPAHDAAVLSRLGPRSEALRHLVNTSQQWDSLRLLDGTASAAEVALRVGIDPSNFRKFLGRLSTAGFVEDGPRGPALTLMARELAAVRSSVPNGKS